MNRLHAQRRIRCLCLMILLATVSTAGAAPRRQAPSKMLASDLYTLVCAYPSAGEALDLLQLRVESVVRGEPRESSSIRVPVGIAEWLDPAHAYLFVFGELQRDTRKGNQYQRVTPGTIASTEGAEPAIFRDCARAATWFDAAEADAERRAQIFAGTQAADRVEQDFMLAELLLRPEFSGTLSAGQTTQIFAIAADEAALPAARQRVIQAALDGVLKVAAKDQHAAWVSVVAHTAVSGVTGELHNPESLVYLSLQQLQAQPKGVKPEVIERWLQSTRPAVAEQAALVLRAIDPAIEKAAVTAALDQIYLSQPTRSFLQDHLRRMKLMAGAATP